MTAWPRLPAKQVRCVDFRQHVLRDTERYFTDAFFLIAFFELMCDMSVGHTVLT
jgi:hypothetical protein